jgi:sporulation protein YlmC with PRC-barrel domain
MKSKITTSLCTALVLASAPVISAYAQAGPLAHAERAANLYGRELVTSDNQQIGKLQNVIVDLESEHVLYVVVGSERGNLAVPPQIIGPTTGNTVRLNVTKQRLEGAPPFNNSQDPAQANYVYRVYQYFGQSPWWQGSAPADQGSFHNVHKLNQLLGMDVQNVNNQTIGKISNVVVDMSQGRLLYVVFAPNSNMNLGNNLYTMPADTFTLSGDHRHLVTGIDQQKLAGAPHFDKNSWPNLTDATFASKVYQYYGKQAYFSTGGSNYQPTGR